MPKQLNHYIFFIINIVVIFTLTVQAKVIHQEKSLYRNILV